MSLVYMNGMRFLPASGEVLTVVPGSSPGNALRKSGRAAGSYSLGYASGANNSSSSYWANAKIILPWDVSLSTEYSFSIGFSYFAADLESSVLNFLWAGYSINVSNGRIPVLGNPSGTATGTVLDSTPSDGSEWHWYSILGNHRVQSGFTQVYRDGVKIAEWVGDMIPTAARTSEILIPLGNDTYSPGDVRLGDVVLYDTATKDQPVPQHRVDVLVPTADGAQGWTPSTGTDHYPLLADANVEPEYDVTTYVSATGSGVDDTFTHEALPHTPVSISGVQVSALASNTDAGARTMSVLCNGAAGTASDPNANNTISGIWETNPSGGAAWTKAAVDSSVIGVRSVT